MLSLWKYFKSPDFAFNHFFPSTYTPVGSEKPYKIGLELIPKKTLF